MIINKKIKRTMMESKSQYLGSLALIILSCLLYTMFNLLSSNMANLSESFESNYVQEDANFRTSQKLTDIEAIESKFNMSIEETKSLDYSVSKDKTLRIFSQNTKVDIPAVIEGKALSGGDILIDPSYAKANKLKTGDTIKIYDKNFKISGFMSLPNYIYPLKTESDILNDPKSFGIAVMGKEDLESLNKGSSFYAVKFNGNKDNLDDKISEFKDYLKSQNIMVLSWMNISENPRVIYVKAKLDSINKMSSSMPVAILILTCILTGIVMWRMLKRESVIIGTLYALGYRKKDIMKHYLMYPLTISLAGGISGTALGALLLRPMVNFMISYFNMPVSSINFYAEYIFISILLPIIFLMVCSYFVVNKSLRNSPVDLMKGGKENNKVGFLERNLKLERLKFATKFKVREQLRSMPRSLFLLLGVAMATMLLLMGFASKSSIDYLMKDSFNEAFKYKYQYVFNTVRQGIPEKGESFCESPFTLKSDNKANFAVYGVNSDSQYIYFKDKAGNTLIPDRIIITRSLADKYSIKVNDTIKIVNKLDSREYSIKVDSIAETYVGEYIYMPLEKFNEMLNYPAGSYMGLWSTDKLDIPEDQLYAAVTVDDMKNALNSMTQPLQAAIGIISFMAFIIGLIVIYVVTSLIIEENKDNISLMKVLGYRKKEVYSLILNSSSFIVVIGYILGVPLLLSSLSALFKSVTKDMTISFAVTLDYKYIFVGFVIIYLTYELSKILSRRKVNRISMAEALKSRME
jgi:putative ABC transport system permease protein